VIALWLIDMLHVLKILASTHNSGRAMALPEL
jgi:hypothetical protein